MKEPYVCALLMSFWTYMVASIFLSLFEDSAITILYCFILDEEHGGSTKTPDALKQFLDIADEKFTERAGRDNEKEADESAELSSEDERKIVAMRMDYNTSW